MSYSDRAVPSLTLIYPPVSLPGEPPVGLAALAGKLRAAGAEVTLVDANVEAAHHLAGAAEAGPGHGRADRRAVAHRQRSLDLLRSAAGYQDLDRHAAAVGTIRRLLALSGDGGGAPARVDLADYHDPRLSPLRSQDLRAACAGAGAGSPLEPYLCALADRVARQPPDVLGISINFLHQALPGLALAGALRARLPRTPLLVGGSLVQCWAGRLPPEGLQPTVDRLVFGDGAGPLSEALGLPCPDAAPPDHHGFPWELYLAPRRVAALTTSEGCHWGRCRYCPQAVGQRCYSRLGGDELGRTLDAVRSRSEADVLHLTDSALPPATLGWLADRRWSASWYGFARFHEDLADALRCDRLRRSGCMMLQLGLESGSPAVLSRLRKGIQPQLVTRVLQALAQAGIKVYLYVMFGIPGETEADAEQTLELVSANAAAITGLNVALLNMPLTADEEPGLTRVPLARTGDLSLYTGFEHQGWERRAARSFAQRRFARQPEVATILRRTPQVFGSTHAPFFGA